MEILHRPRRLRINENIRELARETRLSKSSLIYPVFIREGSGIKEEIPSLVNQYHYSPDRICEEIEQLLAAGIHKILLFGIPAHKDELGSSAWQEDGAVQTDVVWGLLDKAFPPGAFDVVFQLNTQRTVVPCVGKTAVDFGACKDKASAFAQRNDFFHCFFVVVHHKFLLLFIKE